MVVWLYVLVWLYVVVCARVWLYVVVCGCMWLCVRVVMVKCVVVCACVCVLMGWMGMFDSNSVLRILCCVYTYQLVILYYSIAFMTVCGM